MPGRRWLAVDIGGTGIKYALVDDSYRLDKAGLVPTPRTSHTDFIETVGTVFDGFAGNIAGIALSTCGELDPATGHMFSGGTLTYNGGTNIIHAVRDRCGVPVTAENDANCALLAEARLGALTDCTNAAVLVLGTAVGGAIMINRNIYHGSHFHSGNASFTKADLTDPTSPQLDSLNGVQCLTERYARQARVTDREIDGHAFFALVEQGDTEALRTLTQYCTSLANYIFNLQTVLDLDAIAIGGGISAQPALLDELRRQTAHSFARATIPLPRPEIRTCHHFNNSNLIGALLHHREARSSSGLSQERCNWLYRPVGQEGS